MARPRTFTVEQVEEKINEYLHKCESHTVQVATAKGEVVEVNKPRVPSLEGLCNYIGIHRDTWHQWGLEDREFSDLIKNTNNVLANYKVDALLNGDGNATGLIFYLKAKEGWKDKQTIEHEGGIDVTLKLD